MLIDDGVFTFGKYAGEALVDVVRSDSMFIYWVLGASDMLALSESEVSLISRAVTNMIVGEPYKTPTVEETSMMPLDETAWTKWPRVWAEDDATPGTDGHITPRMAWVKLFDEEIDTILALEDIDECDEHYYLMPGERVMVSSWPGNSEILERAPGAYRKARSTAIIPLSPKQETIPPLPIPPLPPNVIDVDFEIPPIPSDLSEMLLRSRSTAIVPVFDNVPPPLPVVAIKPTEEQTEVLAAIQRWYEAPGGGFYAMTGPAGSGKSTITRFIAGYNGGMVRNRAARDNFDPGRDFNEMVRVPAALAAMTGKAALRLAQCAGRSAMTTHSMLYERPKSGPELKFTTLRDPPSNLVVIDESSMISPSIFNDLKKWVFDGGVKILLVGDSYQLPPVITGDELKETGDDWSVFSVVQGSELKTVMRSTGGILRAATTTRETGEIPTDSDGDYQYVSCDSAVERAVDDYCNDPEDHVLVTWRNQIRMTANKMIRARLGNGGPLPDVGEPVLLKKNGQGHLNGEIVRCGGFERGPVLGKSLRTLWMKILGEPDYNKILISYEGGPESKGGTTFDGGSPWIEHWKTYQQELENGIPEPLNATFGYAITGHGCQGSEYRRVSVFMSRDDLRNRNFRKTTTLPNGDKANFSSRFLYTAITRGRHTSTMIVGR